MRSYFAWHYDKSSKYPSFYHFYIDSRLFIHGGAAVNANDKTSLGDLFLFENNMWKKFFVFDQPSPRDQHTLTQVGTELYLYGGNVSPSNKILDEMWLLNIDSVAWGAKALELPGIVWEKVTTLNSPGGLKGHKAVSDKQHLIVFGGTNKDNTSSNILRLYDTQSKQWSVPETFG